MRYQPASVAAAVEVGDRVGRQVAREHRRPAGSTCAPVPMVSWAVAGSTRPEPSAAAAVSAAPAATGMPGRRPRSSAAADVRCPAGVRRAGQYRRRASGVEAEGVQDLRSQPSATTSYSRVAEASLGSVPNSAGEARPKPVLGLQRPPDGCVRLGLVPASQASSGRPSRAERVGQPGTDVGREARSYARARRWHARPTRAWRGGRARPSASAGTMPCICPDRPIARGRRPAPAPAPSAPLRSWRTTTPVGSLSAIPDGDCSPGSRRRLTDHVAVEVGDHDLDRARAEVDAQDAAEPPGSWSFHLLRELVRRSYRSPWPRP